MLRCHFERRSGLCSLVSTTLSKPYLSIENAERPPNCKHRSAFSGPKNAVTEVVDSSSHPEFSLLRRTDQHTDCRDCRGGH